MPLKESISIKLTWRKRHFNSDFAAMVFEYETGAVHTSLESVL